MTRVNSAGVKLVLLAILVAGLLNNYNVAVNNDLILVSCQVTSDEFTSKALDHLLQVAAGNRCTLRSDLFDDLPHLIH